MDNNNQNQFSIDLSPEVAKGKYSNLAVISHSQAEFIMDLSVNLPGMPKPAVVDRIIMTPENAKRLMAALIDNVKKYESNFGEISLDGGRKQGGTINIADLMNGTKS